MKFQMSRIAAVALALAAASCSSTVRQGTGASFLIVDRVVAASGAEPDTFGGSLRSDVLTIVDGRPTVFNDFGQVTFSLGLKDATRGTSPTQNLAITVDRYRVRFIRADGRNTPGVDVPHPFDGAFTTTVYEGTASTAAFQLVRHVAKQEAPLGALASSPVVISTIAEITFYGRDQTGHDVSVTAQIGVDFGNFGDPD